MLVGIVSLAADAAAPPVPPAGPGGASPGAGGTAARVRLQLSRRGRRPRHLLRSRLGLRRLELRFRRPRRRILRALAAGGAVGDDLVRHGQRGRGGLLLRALGLLRFVVFLHGLELRREGEPRAPPRLRFRLRLSGRRPSAMQASQPRRSISSGRDAAILDASAAVPPPMTGLPVHVKPPPVGVGSITTPDGKPVHTPGATPFGHQIVGIQADWSTVLAYHRRRPALVLARVLVPRHPLLLLLHVAGRSLLRRLCG